MKCTQYQTSERHLGEFYDPQRDVPDQFSYMQVSVHINNGLGPMQTAECTSFHLLPQTGETELHAPEKDVCRDRLICYLHMRETVKLSVLEKQRCVSH